MGVTPMSRDLILTAARRVLKAHASGEIVPPLNLEWARKAHKSLSGEQTDSEEYPCSQRHGEALKTPILWVVPK